MIIPNLFLLAIKSGLVIFQNNYHYSQLFLFPMEMWVIMGDLKGLSLNPETQYDYSCFGVLIMIIPDLFLIIIFGNMIIPNFFSFKLGLIIFQGNYDYWRFFL